MNNNKPIQHRPICSSRSAFHFSKYTANSCPGFKFLDTKFGKTLEIATDQLQSENLTLKQKARIFIDILDIPYDETLCDYLSLSYKYNTRRACDLSLLRYTYILESFDDEYDDREHMVILIHFKTWWEKLLMDVPEVKSISFSALLYLFCLTVSQNKQ